MTPRERAIDPRIEIMARAECATDCRRAPDLCNHTAAGCSEWRMYARECRDALIALEAAGYAVVPAAEAPKPEGASGWQPIETAPEEGEFLAWQAHHKRAVTVMRMEVMGADAVIDQWSGKWFRAKWWMPLTPPPQS